MLFSNLYQDLLKLQRSPDALSAVSISISSWYDTQHAFLIVKKPILPIVASISNWKEGSMLLNVFWDAR